MPIGNTNVYNSGDLILNTVSGSGASFTETKIAAATSSLILFNSVGTLTSQSLNSVLVGSSSYALSASYAPGSGLSGGTTNYIPLWTSATTQASSVISQSGNLISVSGSLFVSSSLTASNISVNGTGSIGSVGVGISNPTAKLDVGGSAANGYSLLLRSGDTSGGTDSTQIAFGFDNTSDYRHSIRTRHNSSGFSGNDIDFYLWKFGTDAASTLGTQHVMTLQGDGSVGIGTISPSNKLEVVGNIKANVITASLITGSNITASNVIINGNLTVTGSIYASIFSASNIYITSSQLVVTDNIITLNALSPYQRYAGLEMYDSGSGNLSQFLWDGQGDYFFISGSGVNSKIIGGPDGQGNLTSGKLTKATFTNIIGDSIISDFGNGILVGGYISASNITASLFGTSSWSNNSLTSSYITASNVVGTVTSASYALSASYVPSSLSGGTTNYIPLWTSATTQASSVISQSGNLVNVSGSLSVYTSITASNIKAADGLIGATTDGRDSVVATNDGTQLQTSFVLYQPGNAVDQKTWELISLNSGSSLSLRTINDAYSAAADVFKVNRSTSYFIDGIFFPNGNITASGNISSSGNISARNFIGALTGSTFGTSSYALSASYAPGGSGLSGGTTNYIPLWTSTTTQASSVISQSGNLISVSGSLFVSSSLTASGINIIGTGSFGSVGIGTVNPTSLLNVGSGTPTTAVNGLQFGTDTSANLYRSSAGAIKTDGSLTVSGLNVNGTLTMGSGNQILSTTGTNSSPGISFVGNTNTGIYSPTTNVVGITTNGTEKIRVDSNGNLGIGTNNPSFLLDVSGSSRFGYISSNTHQFTGSVGVSGGLSLTSLTSSGISASNFLSASNIWLANSLIYVESMSTGSSTTADLYFSSSAITGSDILCKFEVGALTGSAIGLWIVATGSQKSYAISASAGDIIGTNFSGSVFNGNFTGSIFGTSSWSNNSFTASYLTPTNSYQITNLTASNISASGTVRALSLVETSTVAAKYNIIPLSYQLDKVMKLNPVSFNYQYNNQSSIGLIAEEVNEIYPEFTTPSKDAVAYGKITSVLIQSIKELKQIIDHQQKQIEDLSKKLK